MKKGQIVKLTGGLYSILDLETKVILQARASGILRHQKLDENSSFNKQLTKRTKLDIKTVQISPKVGDFVLYDNTDINHSIKEIFPRSNELDRPDVANVDQVLILTSVKNPNFSFNLLDQFLILIEAAHIKPVLIVSKIDLIDENALETLKETLTYYERIGYDVHYVNSKQKIGFDTLEDLFRDKLSVLAGQTGAGKSTFLNALMPEFNIKTQEISMALGRGKHTTRHTELYFYGGGMIADTPGFSKLELNMFDPDELKDYFIEFKAYEPMCKFGSSCSHIHEPNCAVKDNENIL
ncbi:MAG: ribosome small subunit-dependent GTPase A, partial [Tenericutes bacterium HGW-Tenericutes-8]